MITAHLEGDGWWDILINHTLIPWLGVGLACGFCAWVAWNMRPWHDAHVASARELIGHDHEGFEDLYDPDHDPSLADPGTFAQPDPGGPVDGRVTHLVTNKGEQQL